MSKNTIIVDGVEYVKKGSELAEKVEGMQYVCIRTYSAGVHLGYLKSQKGTEVELVQSRRVHYWDGAASLSQLALEGTKNPKNSRVSVEIPYIKLTEAIEIINVTKEAKDNIDSIEPWKV